MSRRLNLHFLLTSISSFDFCCLFLQTHNSVDYNRRTGTVKKRVRFHALGRFFFCCICSESSCYSGAAFVCPVSSYIAWAGLMSSRPRAMMGAGLGPVCLSRSERGGQRFTEEEMGDIEADNWCAGER